MAILLRFALLLLLGFLLARTIVGFLRIYFSSSGHSSTGRTRSSQTQGQGAEGQYEPPLSPFEVLGVRRGATKEEIKTAYKKLLSLYHPDKVAHLGEEIQKIAREKTLAINRAYQEIG